MRSLASVSDGRRWWAAESEFEKAKFDQYKFGEWMDGPTFTVVDGLSFAFELQLCPKGAAYNTGEVHDHMGVGIVLVDGPIDELADFKYKLKVYKADGSLELKTAPGLPVTMNKGWGRFNTKALPMAAGQLAPYVLGEEGCEFIKMRVEFGFPTTAFDALAHLPPPAPRQDAAERLTRWCGGGKGCVTIVAGVDGEADRKEFIVHKDLLTEASDVFERMLNSGMTEDVNRRVNIDKSEGAVEALICFLMGGSVFPAAIDHHIMELLDLAERYLLADLKRLCERTVVGNIMNKSLPDDFLDLLEAAKAYNIRVALNVGLCRSLEAYPQLSYDDRVRFNSPRFVTIRDIFMKLSCHALRAIKC